MFDSLLAAFSLVINVVPLPTRKKEMFTWQYIDADINTILVLVFALSGTITKTALLLL